MLKKKKFPLWNLSGFYATIRMFDFGVDKEENDSRNDSRNDDAAVITSDNKK